MLQNNHSLARPCPSCGAPLRVHASRLSQKLQCPKCLDTIVLKPATPAEGIAVRETVASPKRSRAANRTSSAPPSPTSVPAGAYAELLLEHADLTERYAELVTQYDTLVSQHADLTIQLHRLGT